MQTEDQRPAVILKHIHVHLVVLCLFSVLYILQNKAGPSSVLAASKAGKDSDLEVHGSVPHVILHENDQ